MISNVLKLKDTVNVINAAKEVKIISILRNPIHEKILCCSFSLQTSSLLESLRDRL